jgi:hypothetical protein
MSAPCIFLQLRKLRHNVGMKAPTYNENTICSAACVERSRQLLQIVMKHRQARFHQSNGHARISFAKTKKILNGEISRICNHLQPVQKEMVLQRSMRAVFAEISPSSCLFRTFLHLCE